jgi:hypothetical protein
MRVSGKVSDYRSFRGGRPWVTDELKEVDLKKKLETEAGWRQKKKVALLDSDSGDVRRGSRYDESHASLIARPIAG